MSNTISTTVSITWAQSFNVSIEYPDYCPHCNIKCRPLYFQARHNKDIIHGIFECTNEKCAKVFIADYSSVNPYRLLSIYPRTPESRLFSEIILKISPQFCSIFKQAALAEIYKLDDIAWVWYRKALEFLIKDYLIDANIELKDRIENSQLWACIQDYIKNENIKQVAKRAVWIGNDETHYVRKWENKDIEDLKKLIELTLNWIQMEIQTKELLVDMP